MEQGRKHEVALKVIAWSAFRDDAEDQRRRWNREHQYFEVLRRGRLQGVARLYGYGLLRPSRIVPYGGAYLAYELIRGRTLRTILATPPLPAVSEVWGFVDFATTVDELHEMRITHRDIKPDNIVFRGSHLESPVLIDFGIARSLTTTYQTSTGATWTSKYYSPPEAGRLQEGATGEPSFEAWDRYSFAKVVAVFLAVALGMPLVEAEQLRDEWLLERIERKLPGAAWNLKAGLSRRPKQRPEASKLLDDVALAAGDDLWELRTRPKSLKKLAMLLSAKTGRSVAVRLGNLGGWWGGGPALRATVQGASSTCSLCITHTGQLVVSMNRSALLADLRRGGTNLSWLHEWLAQNRKYCLVGLATTAKPVWAGSLRTKKAFTEHLHKLLRSTRGSILFGLRWGDLWWPDTLLREQWNRAEPMLRLWQSALDALG